MMYVKYKPTGQVGTIDDNEFDPSIYEAVGQQKQTQPQTVAQPQVQAQTNQTTSINNVPLLGFLTKTIAPRQTRNVIDPAIRTIGMGGDYLRYLLAQTPEEKQKVAQDYTQKFNEQEDWAGKVGFATQKTGGLNLGKLAKEIGQTGLEAGSFAIPAGQGVKGMAKMGALSGVLRGASEAETPTELLTKALGGGVGGAAAGATIGFGEKALRGIFRETPKRLMESVFKEPIKNTKAAISKGSSLGAEALERGEKGTAESIYRKALNQLADKEDELQDLLVGATDKVDTNKIRASLNPTIQKMIDAGDVTTPNAVLERLANIESTSGTKIPAARANEIKRTIYDEIRKNYGQKGTPGQELLKQLAKGFKDQIADIPGVSAYNKDLSYFGRVANSMEDKLAREGRNNIIGLTDAILSAGSGFNPAVVGAVVGKKIAGSTPGKTGTAIALNKMGDIGEALANSTVGRSVGEPMKRGSQILGGLIGTKLPQIFSGEGSDSNAQYGANQETNYDLTDHTGTISQTSLDSQMGQNKADLIKRAIAVEMVKDLANGGKNVTELQAIQTALLNAYAPENTVTAVDRKRINSINAAESIYNQVARLALDAPSGLEGSIRAGLGKFPGVEGGASEDLDRVTRGFAKAIASAFAGEVGVATDRDIERWLGLMPKITDTREERVRALERLKEQIDMNKKQFGL